MDFLIPADLTIPKFLRREPPLSDYERDDRDSKKQIRGLKWANEQVRQRQQPPPKE